MSGRTIVCEKQTNGDMFPLGQIVPNIDERVRKLENDAGAVVVTVPEVEGNLSLPIGKTSELTVSASSLLVGVEIAKFTYSVDDSEEQEVEALSNRATISIEIPEDTLPDTTFELKVTAYDSYGSYNRKTVTLTAIQISVVTPTISGKTIDFVAGGDTFSGSEFIVLGAEGNHDKSDWVLYKKTGVVEPEEVWSSRDDTENLVTCPKELAGALEVSTSYIIKVRYHDSINDIWSEYGELEFVTSEIFEKPWAPNVDTAGIHFIAATDASNVNIFTDTFDDCVYEVWINNERTEQSYTDISFTTDDDVLIKCVSGENSKFPAISFYNKNYIKEITEPLPLFTISSSGQPVTDFSNCFYGCSNLTAIPTGLFDNNTAVTSFTSCFPACRSLTTIPIDIFRYNTAVKDFSNCFKSCSKLTTIPSGLFRYNTEVTSFSNCFESCSKLTTIPTGLFDNNTAVTSFYNCFYGCTNLTTIPSGLFRYNTEVNSFRSCFYGCSNLTTIPTGLFRYNTKVQDFDSCFNGCSKLTTIPDNLFDANTLVLGFGNCFYGCYNLTAIPTGLFRYNTKAGGFRFCFYACSNLTTIPVDIFRYNTAVKDFSNCFKSCSNLTTIPVDIFRYNTAVTDFSSCFSGCSKVTVIARIGSQVVNKVSSFAQATNSKGTVYVPSGSTTASNFKSSDNANVNVIEE